MVGKRGEERKEEKEKKEKKLSRVLSRGEKFLVFCYALIEVCISVEV